MLTLLAQLEFEHPARLAWLLVLPLLAYFAWRSRSSASPRRRLASLACRIAMILLLVAAFAGIAFRGTSDQRRVILLVDASRSVHGEGRKTAARFVDAASAAGGAHEIVEWRFAERPLAMDYDPAGEMPPLDEMVSDPAAAVRSAAASIPSRYIPQVVLLSDGNETRGEVAKAALGAGMPIDVVPLPSFSEPDACLLELIAQPPNPLTRSVRLEAVAYANHEGPARLQWAADGQTITEQQVPLTVGENRFFLTAPLGSAESTLIELKIAATSDAMAENNVRRTRVFAPARPRILLVDTRLSQAENFRAALAADRFDVDLLAPERFAERAGELASYDLVVLSNVSPRQWTEDAGDALDRYVHDLGGGLIVAGGEDTFGEAAYRDSSLERALPVTAAAAVETKKSVLALVLVIDRSSSMQEERRMELAKQAAKQSVQLLQPHDKAGVIAFSDLPLWISEIAPVSNKEQLLQAIDTLRPGGQTNMYQAVERAFLALEQTDADRRYMILLTDGIPAPGDYRAIAQRMARQGITLSTVSISAGAEQDLLVEMARIAGGRHHHCDDPDQVPEILVQETRVATSDDGGKTFSTSVYRALPGLDVASAPQLAGYALTNLKPQAEQLLMAAGRDPLLAWWPYGSGLAAAFTCDPHGPATGAWQAWPGYADFWQRLARHVVRRPEPPTMSLSVERHGEQAAVTVQIETDLAAAVDASSLRLTLDTPNGVKQTLPWEPMVAGRYRASFSASDLGEYRIEARLGPAGEPQQVARASLLIDYPDELRLRPTNSVLLQAIAETTGGRFDPSPEDLFTADDRTVERRTSPWPYLVLAALLLLVTDLAIRRLRFG